MAQHCNPVACRLPANEGKAMTASYSSRDPDPSSTSGTSRLGLRTLATSAARSVLAFTQNSFALVGLAVMFLALALMLHPEWRQTGETQLMGWLQARQTLPGDASGDGNGIEEADVSEPGAVDRATATNPQSLPKQQAAVAHWLSKKYRVAPEPLSALVVEAFGIGARTKLDPTLILAVMAVESGFNPFAQSAVGAQGLMQVMTKIHSDKYEIFGGKLAAFDPLTNLRVGVKVLQECIARAGSIEAGLKFYVGAANIEDDGGYTAKVLAEHGRLKLVSAGRSVPLLSAVSVTTTTNQTTTLTTTASMPAAKQSTAAVMPVNAEPATEAPVTLVDS